MAGEAQAAQKLAGRLRGELTKVSQQAGATTAQARELDGSRAQLEAMFGEKRAQQLEEQAERAEAAGRVSL